MPFCYDGIVFLGLTAPDAGECCDAGAAKRKGSMFFFEKKNQKTFAPVDTRPNSNWAAYASEQKFFASFFQKRRPSLP
jgi:hypothetical protein